MNLVEIQLSSETANHFGVKKQIMRDIFDKAVRESNDGIISVSLSGLGICFTEHFYASKELVITSFNFKKFAGSNAYATMIELKQTASNMLMAMTDSKDNLYIMRTAASYDGMGGVFVKEKHDAAEGIIVEPYKHYLKAAYYVNDAAVD